VLRRILRKVRQLVHYRRRWRALAVAAARGADLAAARHERRTPAKKPTGRRTTLRPPF
jgi:hypothetical protein